MKGEGGSGGGGWSQRIEEHTTLCTRKPRRTHALLRGVRAPRAPSEAVILGTAGAFPTCVFKGLCTNHRDVTERHSGGLCFSSIALNTLCTWKTRCFRT